MIEKIKDLVAGAQHIVVIQADNPDADSLGSALALEQILGEMGKNVWLYCGVDMPSYLHYLSGHDRVNTTLPSTFDLSIVVDTSAQSLLQKLQDSGQQGWVAARPCIVLDHHETSDNNIVFATVSHLDAAVSSTAELIYNLVEDFNWPLDTISATNLCAAILGDTQGLSNNLAVPSTYRAMAGMIEKHGVDRPKLEELRRLSSKMEPTIYRYKAELINRTEFDLDGQVASVTIPQDEIKEYSPLYNPAPLIQSDMLMTAGVGVALVYKHYDDGKILCSCVV